jgi:hypothetical protein
MAWCALPTPDYRLEPGRHDAPNRADPLDVVSFTLLPTIRPIPSGRTPDFLRIERFDAPCQ